MPKDVYKSESTDSDSDWNKELIHVLQRKSGKLKVISEEERIERIKECLIEGANIDTVNESGNTALHVAVKKGYLRICQFLVERGAKTDIRNLANQTALTLAESCGNEDILNTIMGSTNRGSLSASQKMDSTSEAALATNSGPSTSRDRHTMLKDGQESSKRKASADNEDSEYGKKRQLGSPEKAEAKFSSVKDSQSKDDTIGDKTGVHRQMSPFGESMMYAVGGLKTSLHAVMYRMRLLMLFVYRGLRHNYSFRIATEMDIAEKFDDLVFEYKDETESGDGTKSKTVYRFLEVKHNRDETRRINASDLLSERDNNNFGLQKYFISYRKIINNPEFKGSTFKDFIIYTNIDFNFEGLESADIRIEKVDEPDDFLDMKSVRKRPARYKFLVSYQSEMWKILKRAGDIHNLAKTLVEHVYRSKAITLRDDLFKRYHIALAEEVIDVNNKKFSNRFIEGIDLSGRGEKFREIFLAAAAKRFAEKLGKYPPEDAVWKEMAKITLNICPRFGQKPTINLLPEFSEELVELIQHADSDYLVKVDRGIYREDAECGSRQQVFADNIDKLAGHLLILENKKIKFRSQFLQNDELPGNLGDLRNSLKDKLGTKYNDLDRYQFEMPEHFTITEEEPWCAQLRLPEDEVENVDIGEFFDKLIFAVNQPNEIELGRLITSEIGAHERIKPLSADMVSVFFEKEMLDWCKERGRAKRLKGRFYSNMDAQDFFDSAERKLNGLMTSELNLLYYAEELKGYDIEFKDENEVLKNFLTCDFHYQVNSALQIIVAHETLPTAIRVQQTIQRLDDYRKNGSLMFLRLSTLLLPDIERRVTLALKSLDSHHLLVIDCESATKQDLQGLYSRLSQAMSRTMDVMLEKTMKKNNKKLILIIRDNEPGVLFENCCETQDDASFKHLTTNSKLKLMAEKIIRLQEDEQRTSFRKLLDISAYIAMQDLGGVIDTDIFVKLIRREEIRIGGDLQGLGEVDKYYIPRTIVQEVIIKDNIFESQLEFDEFAISTGEKNAPKFRGLVLERGKEAEEFEKLCKASGKNVHWLKYVSGKFVWHRSRGNITFLMKYRDVSESLSSNDYDIHQTDLISSTEYDLVDLDDGRQVVIISGSAGTGKSTMLTSLTKKIKRKNPGHWVIRIDLNDFTKVLDQVPQRQSSDGSDTDRAIEFFVENLSKQGTKLDKQVLKTMMMNGSKVVLLFDEFNEISPTYTKVVIDLLQGLKIGGAKLFVATRPHTQALLEEELKTFSYTMQPFTNKNQYDFLISFWKSGLGLDNVEDRIEQRLNTYAETLIESVVESIDATARAVVSVPGRLRIIAKLFQGGEDGQVRERPSETCEEYLRSENDEPHFRVKLNIADLYRSFVDNDFYMHITEKKSDESSNQGVQDSEVLREIFFKRHQELAVHSLFGVENLDDSSEMLTHPHLLNQREIIYMYAYMAQIIEGRERIGIITQVVNGRSQFIHRTFAEYFAATFIFDTLLKRADRNPDVRKFLVQNILAQPEYKVIRAFLNGLLSNVSQQSDDQHAGDSDVNEAWKVDFDKYSYQDDSIFHKAAREGHYEIMKFFLNRIDQHETRKDLISTRVGNDLRTVLRIVTDNQQWDELEWLIQNGGAEVGSLIGDDRTLLHAAAAGNAVDMMKWLIQEGARVDAPDNHGITPLHEAARFGRSDVLRWLVKKTNIYVKSHDEKSVAMLHYAVHSDEIPLLEWLIKERGSPIKVSIGETMLLHAARFGNWDGVKILAEFVDIEIESLTGGMVLFHAVKQDDIQTIEWLVYVEGISVGPTYANGSSILHHAIATGSINVVKWLISKNNADPNEIDNKGCAPLAQALETEKMKIFEWLLDYSDADVNAKDGRGMTSLHVAAKSHPEMIDTLVNDYGADIDALDNDGKRPIDLYGDGPDREFLESGPR